MLPIQLCLGILVAWFLYACYTVLYRLFFHPPAHFPGSKLAATTKWYELYFDLLKCPSGTFIYEVERMHEKYGTIVRINPDELHIKDTEWVGTLYTGSASDLRDKYPLAALMLGIPQSVSGTIDHHVHKKRRAALSLPFSKTSIASAEPMIHEKVELLGERLKAQLADAGIAEMRRYYLATTTDILSQHVFDKSLNLLQKDQAAKDWQNTVKAAAKVTPLVKQFTWIIPFALRLPLIPLQIIVPATARFVALRRDIQKQAHETVLKTQASPKENFSKTSNLFENLLSSHSLAAQDKEHQRIAQEGFVVLLAGGETTARVLTTATFFLLTNQATALAKLMVELKSVMPDPNARVELKTLEHLPWLTAVIKESLRITAIVTSRLPLVSPKEPLRYKDWEIPPGLIFMAETQTPVSMTLRDVLLDPIVFEHPLEFIPDRWLSSNPNLDRMNKAYVPFSRGGRMCLAMNFAVAELYIIIACLFRRFNIELYDTIRERDIDMKSDFFIGEPSLESLGVRVRAVAA